MEKIALIDDSNYIREGFIKMMGELNCTDYSVFEFGKEFVNEYEQVAQTGLFPDVVLLDWTILNGMWADEILEAVYSYNPNQVVVLYGGFQLDDIPKFLKMGIKNFLSKPVEIEKLEMFLNKYVEKRS